MNIQVVNIRSFKMVDVTTTTTAIYIGRQATYKGTYYKSSSLHNPFKITKDCDRESCLHLYREHIEERLENPQSEQSKVIDCLVEVSKTQQIARLMYTLMVGT